MSADRKRNILQLCKIKRKSGARGGAEKTTAAMKKEKRLAATTITTTGILPLVNTLSHSTPTALAATAPLNERHIISGQLPPIHYSRPRGKHWWRDQRRSLYDGTPSNAVTFMCTEGNKK